MNLLVIILQMKGRSAVKQHVLSVLARSERNHLPTSSGGVAPTPGEKGFLILSIVSD